MILQRSDQQVRFAGSLPGRDSQPCTCSGANAPETESEKNDLRCGVQAPRGEEPRSAVPCANLTLPIDCIIHLRVACLKHEID